MDTNRDISKDSRAEGHANRPTKGQKKQQGPQPGSAFTNRTAKSYGLSPQESNPLLRCGDTPLHQSDNLREIHTRVASGRRDGAW